MEDEHFAKLVQQGDKNAFGTLVERYEKKITRYANKFLYNYQDREDAVQDVFIKAYKNIQSFNTKEKFSPWIYRIAHNTFLNVIRKRKTEKITLFDTDQLFVKQLSDDSEARLREQSEDREVLEQYISRLDVKYREVLVLFYFEEKDYEEISDIVGIPKSTVGVRLRRGRERMKQIYEI